MKTLLIRHATLVLPDSLVGDQSVFCRGGRIEQVGPDAALRGVSGAEDFDAHGMYLAPGFIDLHIHGAQHYLLDNGPDQLEGLCRLLPQYGVTGFLPTLCPRRKGEDAMYLSRLAATSTDGARVLGFHLEGPFLTLTGALPAEALGAADPDRVQALIRAAGPFPVVFSIAPDFKGILDLLPLMRQGGAPVFMTHTAANVEQSQAAIEAGARHATHFYDVFPVPPVTEPGVRPCGAVEAILADPRVSVDFILDGEHVDPVAIQMALACKGPDRVCLVTDANIGAGMPPCRARFTPDTEIEFHYEGGPARMTENSSHPGCLAGSGLTLDRAVRNAVRLLGVGIPQAVRMATGNVAQVLGRDREKGRIESGFDADLVLLDADLGVLRTWVGGEEKYRKDDGRQ